MSLFDIFKKKKKEVKEKPVPKKEVPVKVQKPKETKEEFIRVEPAKKRKISPRSSKILLSPQITEKATILSEDNKYVFKVSNDANKTEIKKAVEGIYGVEVIGTNIIKIPHKARRVGKKSGWKKGYKKAVVSIKEGQKIEILSR